MPDMIILEHWKF